MSFKLDLSSNVSAKMTVLSLSFFAFLSGFSSDVQRYEKRRNFLFLFFSLILHSRLIIAEVFVVFSDFEGSRCRINDRINSEMERHSVESEKVKKTKGKVTRLPNRCQICSANALYSHFGVISCSSCQMFFKRNAEKNNQVNQ